MNKSQRVLFWLISATIFTAVSQSPAEVIPIDLNTFSAVPNDSVIVTPDGVTATLSEDPIFAPILLSNDPGFGDPGLGDAAIIFGGPAAFLLFDYDFAESSPNDDEFLAFVLTESGDGGSAGPEFEFFTQENGSGRVKFDILPLATEVLGLQFQLNSFDTTVGSSVTISNVTIVTPEPRTIALFVILGIVIITLHYRKTRKSKRQLLPKNDCVG